jgi:hypothetical protein
MNSLRSALTPVLAGPPDPVMQTKGVSEGPFQRHCLRGILSIGLVQNIGQVTSQVAKQHGDKLCPAPEAAGVALGAMLADGRLEFKTRDEPQDLGENAAYSVHGGGLLTG